jgi:hypothetical protein
MFRLLQCCYCQFVVSIVGACSSADNSFFFLFLQRGEERSWAHVGDESVRWVGSYRSPGG